MSLRFPCDWPDFLAVAFPLVARTPVHRIFTLRLVSGLPAVYWETRKLR